MSPLATRLGEPRPLLLDGGLGSMLIARGLPAGTPPEAWVLDRPGEVAAVHRAYVEAGSEAIHATTFGANRKRLSHFDLHGRLAEINRAAVRLARESGARFVLGDMGPSGEYLPPVGSADPASWSAAFREQAEILMEAGVDGLHVETMSDLREARTALDALRAVAPELPVFVSMTFEHRKRGFFTVMGDAAVASLRALADAGADVVGANCSITSRMMRELAAELGEIGRPVVLQPNAGVPELVSGTTRYGQSSDEYAADAEAMLAAGARVIGGCCGTDPSFIAALAERLGRR